MTEQDFARAAFEPALRQQLQAALQSDPVLRQRARERVSNLAKMQDRGQIFDRDAVSRQTHEMLTRMLAQADAFKRDEPTQVTIEVKATLDG